MAARFGCEATEEANTVFGGCRRKINSVRRLVLSAAADTKDSKTSLLLQIDVHGDFETPSEQFLASEVARQEVCKALSIETQEARAKFVKKFLESKPLGQLVGDIFEVMVLNMLIGKGRARRTHANLQTFGWRS